MIEKTLAVGAGSKPALFYRTGTDYPVQKVPDPVVLHGALNRDYAL